MTLTTRDWDTPTDTPAAVDGPWQAPEAWSDPEMESTSTHALFDGDEGGLSLAQRKALVVLLKNRFVSSQSHPEEWRALTDSPGMVRARLNDLFLDLHLDSERQVAFKYQVTPEAAARFPTLLHATEWTREETILLVHLRSLAHAAHAAGELRVFVDRQDLMEAVASMRPDTATDQVRDGGRTKKAIEALVSAGLLVGRKDDDRFEIARAVDVILPLERLQQLLTWIRADGAESTAGQDGPPDGEPDIDEDGPAR